MADNDTRITNGQGGYSSGVWVDSHDPDIVYTIATTVYRSTDGGKTFSAFKGAPGGEDPHCAWIDPTNGQRIFFGFDQGPAITLDGGYASWNKDDFRKAGLDPEKPPRTLDDLDRMADALTRRDGGQITRIGIIPCSAKEAPNDPSLLSEDPPCRRN